MKKISALLCGVFIFLCCSVLMVPQLGEAASIHAILVGDVHDPNIGPGDRLDLNLMKGLLNDIARNTGMPLKMNVIDDRIERSTVMSAVRNLNPGSDDMVIFYYTGHGYRMRSMNTKWPAMALDGPDNQTAGLDQYWVYNVLKQKNPRLLMVMTDACNNYVQEGAIDTTLSVQSSQERRESYNKLFRQYRGAIIASSSIPGQYSFSGSTGSQFTVAFIRNLRSALGETSPSWERIMKSSVRPLMNGRQVPQYALNDSGSASFTDSGDAVQPPDENRETVPEPASGEGASLFSQLLLQLEASVKYSAQSSGWRGQRSQWVSDVRSAGSSGDISRLRELLVTFETNIQYSAQNSNWPGKRANWIQTVQSSVSISSLIAPLLEVEASIKYSAQSDSWRSRRSAWRSQVSGISGTSGNSSEAPGDDNNDRESGSSFGTLLIELEASVNYSAQSSNWRNMRSGWISSVRSAGSDVARLREVLITFETNIKYSSQSDSWRSRRSAWVQQVGNAGSISELKNLMIEVESSIKYSAQSDSWRQRRAGWLQAVRGL
ncbi:MAG TPA: caspase family protein [Spirochaetota bacterium]|nr:caspase family protein [Spirochaetota bacterium]